MAPKQITLPSGAKRWQARWRDAGGNQRSKNFDRQVDAAKHERRMLAERDAGGSADPSRGRLTVRDWSDQWLTSAHNLRARAKLAYERDLVRILTEIGDLRLDQVTDSHIDSYLSSLAEAPRKGAKNGETISPATVHHHYRTLRRMFRVAVQRGRIPRSPVDPVAAPYVPPEEMRFLDANQLEALAATPCLGAYRTLILVGGWGGLRWGELAALRATRCDTAGSRVHVVTQFDPEGKVESEPKSKTGNRWVTLPPSVMAELADRIDEPGVDGLLWTSSQGMRLRHTNFLRRTFAPAAREIGQAGLTPHDLRHTAVALAIAEGAHPKAIQMRMGHSSIMVTLDRYGHLFPEMDATLGQRLDVSRGKALDERRKLRVV